MTVHFDTRLDYIRLKTVRFGTGLDYIQSKRVHFGTGVDFPRSEIIRFGTGVDFLRSEIIRFGTGVDFLRSETVRFGTRLDYTQSSSDAPVLGRQCCDRRGTPVMKNTKILHLSAQIVEKTQENLVVSKVLHIFAPSHIEGISMFTIYFYSNIDLKLANCQRLSTDTNTPPIK